MRHLWFPFFLLLTCQLGMAANSSIVLGPAHPALDPQGVLSVPMFGNPTIPVGASAVMGVENGNRHIKISDGQGNLTQGGTQGGSLGGLTVTDDMLLTYMISGFELTPHLADSYDISRDGKIDVADLAWVLEYPNDEVNTGGNPWMLITARPDGDGPLRDDSVFSTSPMVVTAGEDPVTGSSGQFIDLLVPTVVDNLMSLAPSSVDVHAGDVINIGLQIDGSVAFGQTKGYTAQIILGSHLSFEGTLRGATDNSDFSQQPIFIFPNAYTLQIGTEVNFRTDVGEPVINVANFNVRVSENAPVGTIPLIFLDQGTLIPNIGNPIPPPTVKLLGCGMYVLPF